MGVGVSACGCVIYVVRPLRVGVAHAAASPPLQHARASVNCTSDPTLSNNPAALW